MDKNRGKEIKEIFKIMKLSKVADRRYFERIGVTKENSATKKDFIFISASENTKNTKETQNG